MTQALTIAPGLHFVATPIGSARDITLRALDVLSGVDVIAAEDTRTARKLMEIHGIAVAGRPMIPYHDHNGEEARPRVLAALEKGLSVAYVSEAGTPLVADPGYQLGRSVLEAGGQVFSAPGASAALAALTVSGLASDRFLFAGFPPTASGARRRWLEKLDAAGATAIIYESPKRVHRTLTDICEISDSDREVALCRELTKRFEEVLRGTCGQVRDMVAERMESGRTIKGEVVLVLGRASPRDATPDQVEAALRDALDTMPLKAASALVAQQMRMSKRDVYQMGLRLKNDG